LVDHAALHARSDDQSGKPRLFAGLDSDGHAFAGLVAVSDEPRELSPTSRDPEDPDQFRYTEAIGQGQAFVCASNVFTNRLRVFDLRDISVDGVVASACIPSVFQAVEIDGEFYWDGGYMGNPPIFPIIYNCVSTDVLLIMVNPIHIEQVPNSAQAILDRINTLSFNSSLMREMRAINFVNHLVESGFDDDGRLKRMLIHCIDAEDEMSRLGVSSKLNVCRDFLTWLFELGRERADAFLRDHFETLGKNSSISIEQRFL
jgi:NTE family protein